MATKSNFTSEEWGKLLASPMVAGMAITAADPGGLWGLLKEGMAEGWALLEAQAFTWGAVTLEKTPGIAKGTRKSALGAPNWLARRKW